MKGNHLICDTLPRSKMGKEVKRKIIATTTMTTTKKIEICTRERDSELFMKIDGTQWQCL